MSRRDRYTFLSPTGCLREIPGTLIRWQGLGGWLAAVEAIGGITRASSDHYSRCGALYRSLEAGDIHGERDLAVLGAAEALFDRARHAEVPAGRGLLRILDRATLGAFLVEVRNQMRRVELGRLDRPRIKGPRLDPRRLPDAALARLIQSHRDLATVDRLRDERRRRQELVGLEG